MYEYVKFDVLTRLTMCLDFVIFQRKLLIPVLFGYGLSVPDTFYFIFLSVPHRKEIWLSYSKF